MSGMPLAGGQSAGVVKKYPCTRVANNRVGVNHWNSAAKASKFSESPTESHSIINDTLPGHVVSQRRAYCTVQRPRAEDACVRRLPVYGGFR